MDNADPDGETNFLNSNHNTKWTEPGESYRRHSLLGVPNGLCLFVVEKGEILNSW